MAVAAVTKRLRLLALLLLTGALPLFAAVLPEERTDVLYHRYDGGGLTVDGPSVLVRKNFKDKVSVTANYYVDKVSSASIDVVTQASPQGFQETRTEKSLGVDYLYDRSLLSAGVITSDESDYHSRTFHFDVSQDFFGDLTTLSMGYTHGSDTVYSNAKNDFKATARHQEYRVGISQILTRDLLMSLTEEIISDQGYLHSPYRSVRYLITDGSGNVLGTGSQDEVYPESRTSNTTTLQAMYHLPYRASVYGKYRHYSDGWDIRANTYELGYIHTLPSGWIFDVHYRRYKQTKANFYSDLFPYQNAQTYLARDRQLSDFNSTTWGLGISYELPWHNTRWIDKSSLNLNWDHVRYHYDDFRDIRNRDYAPGTEPLYHFDADIIRAFISVWY